MALAVRAPQAQSPVPNLHPIIGLWRQNVDKSTYLPGPVPASVPGSFQGRNYIDRGSGLIGEVRENVGVSARPFPAIANVWSGRFDGPAAAVFTQADLLTLLENAMKPMTTRAYRAVDANTLEATNKTGIAAFNDEFLRFRKARTTDSEP